MQDLVDHIDYVVRRIGIDHVGFSSDFFNETFSLTGWRNAAEMSNVTGELVRRGYGLGEIGSIWSGNILRGWRQAEKMAAA
ncbi:MAG: membrane dipeptidase [Anaerolineales bacterium]|nr:membrane dipeptidase [Anaerolineales bacterium]